MTHWIARTEASAPTRGAELTLHRTVRDVEVAGLARGDDVELRFGDGTRHTGTVVSVSVKGARLRTDRLTFSIRRVLNDQTLAHLAPEQSSVWVIYGIER